MRELYYNFDLDMNPLLDMDLPTTVRHNRILVANINPKFTEELKKINIIPANAAVFYSAPGFSTLISHVDCYIRDLDADWPSIAKINYIVGEKETKTMWYDVPAEQRTNVIKGTTRINQYYMCYNLKVCREIENVSLHGWHLFEAGVPHTVKNPTPNPKWTISFVARDTRTNEWLTYAECKERLLKL